MADDEYAHVAGGKLKLKHSGDIQIKKKKHKKKDKAKLKAQIEKTVESSTQNNPDAPKERTSSSTHVNTSNSASSGRVLTKAELAFKKMQEKTVRTMIDR